MVRETDALLVGGGDPLYLCYWMRQSGLADLLPSLHEIVYVGVSAGSLVMAPNVGEDFVYWKPPTGRKRVMAATKHRTLAITFNAIGIGVEGKAKPNAAQIANTRNMADRV